MCITATIRVRAIIAIITTTIIVFTTTNNDYQCTHIYTYIYIYIHTYLNSIYSYFSLIWLIDLFHVDRPHAQALLPSRKRKPAPWLGVLRLAACNKCILHTSWCTSQIACGIWKVFGHYLDVLVIAMGFFLVAQYRLDQSSAPDVSSEAPSTPFQMLTICHRQYAKWLHMYES